MQKLIGNMPETIEELNRKNQALETTRQAELRSHAKVAEELGQSKLPVIELEKHGLRGIELIKSRPWEILLSVFL